MKNFKNLTLITQIAFQMISPILIGVFIGIYLDRWLNTSPVLVIIFMVLGVCSGFLGTYKLMQKSVFKDDKKSFNDEREKNENQ